MQGGFTHWPTTLPTFSIQWMTYRGWICTFTYVVIWFRKTRIFWFPCWNKLLANCSWANIAKSHTKCVVSCVCAHVKLPNREQCTTHTNMTLTYILKILLSYIRDYCGILWSHNPISFIKIWNGLEILYKTCYIHRVSHIKLKEVVPKRLKNSVQKREKENEEKKKKKIKHYPNRGTLGVNSIRKAVFLYYFVPLMSYLLNI